MRKTSWALARFTVAHAASGDERRRLRFWSPQQLSIEEGGAAIEEGDCSRVVGWWPTTVAVPTPTRAPQIFGHRWDFDPPDCRLNVAVTVVAAPTVTVQGPVPVQAPFQPANVEPAAGSAVRISRVPAVTGSEQSAPQVIPGPVTMPEPEPFLVTQSV